MSSTNNLCITNPANGIRNCRSPIGDKKKAVSVEMFKVIRALAHVYK